MPSTVTIYTDGACGKGEDAPGGWAAILIYEDEQRQRHHKELSGGVAKTTNNRMELMGVLEGLRALKFPVHVTIYSDSQYVVNGVGSWANGYPKSRAWGWMVNWKKRGWTRKEGVLKNVDLWQLLDAEVRKHKSVTLEWVRGHDGNEFNERCDVLAVNARLNILETDDAAVPSNDQPCPEPGAAQAHPCQD